MLILNKSRFTSMFFVYIFIFWKICWCKRFDKYHVCQTPDIMLWADFWRLPFKEFSPLILICIFAFKVLISNVIFGCIYTYPCSRLPCYVFVCWQIKIQNEWNGNHQTRQYILYTILFLQQIQHFLFHCSTKSLTLDWQKILD